MSNFRTGTSVFPTFSSGSADTLKLLASSGRPVSHGAARKMARGVNVASRTKPLSPLFFRSAVVFLLNQHPEKATKRLIIQSPGLDLTSIS